MAKKKKKKGSRFMQAARESMKRRGTEGSFRAWCEKRGFSSGCSPGCIAAGKRAGGKIAKKANLATAF